MCKPAWSCNYEVEQDRGSINYAFDRVREAAMAERTEFVMLYTNPQSIVWNEDTAQFLDEWTQFDMCVPLSCRVSCHLLCRSERLLRRADPLAWDLSSDQDANWFYPGSAAAGYRRFVPTGNLSAAYNFSIGQFDGSAYYRDPVDSYATMVLHAERQMLRWSDGVYCKSNFPQNFFVDLSDSHWNAACWHR